MTQNHRDNFHNIGEIAGSARRRRARALILAAAALSVASPAAAQIAERVLGEPAIAILREAPRLPGEPLAAAPQLDADERGAGNQVFYDLAIDYTEGRLYNPSTDSWDTVSLRSYVGEVTNPDVPFVAPQVEIYPGETFRLTLDNMLPADDPSCEDHGDDPNTPHCFNSTNMHTHGLWISPAGNSDNVLLTIRPDVMFQYEYNIPLDHPAGTFWYHPHLHGSTALQVSSGMVGTLIIRGDRPPERQDDGSIKPGDIGTLLVTPEGDPYQERVVLMQQIAYACYFPDGRMNTNPDTGVWECDEGQVGTIETYNQLGLTSWTDSGRHTSINGVVLPTFPDATAGAVERWRVIHAGVRNSVKLRFQKASPAIETEAYDAALPADRAAEVDMLCEGEPLDVLGMATDGLNRPEMDVRQDTVLQPGYREDLLVMFPEPGTYCVIDGEFAPEQTVNGNTGGRELLGYVEVGPGEAVDPANTVGAIMEALVASAEVNMPADVRAQVVGDLEDGMKLTSFVWHKPIPEEEVTGEQTLSFVIDDAFRIGQIEETPNGLQPKDPEPYDPSRVDRNLVLHGVDEWTLTSFVAGHPFHIHVNPFEVIEVLAPDPDDPNGPMIDVSGPDAPMDSQYRGLKGTWKDTLFVQQDYVLKVRTRYERYIGEYVLHCHILDHEDKGMMQNVMISIPDTEGMPTGEGH